MLHDMIVTCTINNNYYFSDLKLHIIIIIIINLMYKVVLWDFQL